MNRKLITMIILIFASQSCNWSKMMKSSYVKNGVCDKMKLHSPISKGDYSILGTKIIFAGEYKIISLVKDITPNETIIEQGNFTPETKENNYFHDINKAMQETSIEYHVDSNGNVINAYLLQGHENRTKLSVTKDACSANNYFSRVGIELDEVEIVKTRKGEIKGNIFYTVDNYKNYYFTVYNKEIPFNVIRAFMLKEKDAKKYISMNAEERAKIRGLMLIELIDFHKN